jgi:hypothetical protein
VYIVRDVRHPAGAQLRAQFALYFGVLRTRRQDAPVFLDIYLALVGRHIPNIAKLVRQPRPCLVFFCWRRQSIHVDGLRQREVLKFHVEWAYRGFARYFVGLAPVKLAFPHGVDESPFLTGAHLLEDLPPLA